LKVGFLIHIRTFREASANDQFWPKIALRRHRKSDRFCDSHEGLESTDTVEKLGTWAEVTLRVKH
jgi:hypothetical protein